MRDFKSGGACVGIVEEEDMIGVGVIVCKYSYVGVSTSSAM